jgi:hypothetical protein
MVNCTTTIKRIIFDVSDAQMTKVRIEIDFEGDCPIQLKRVYEKSFPARFSAVDILTMEHGGVQNYLEW